tara:strand:- start:746 stop:1471 length:726 start_codon:yes stop_codon:yes gene_type:complete
MNYTALSTAIQDYCQNSETAFVANIDNFILAAEDKVFLSVQMPGFWNSDITQVTASGTSSYALEAGVIDVLSARVGESVVSGAEAVDSGPVRYLLRKEYDFLLEAYPGTSGASSTGIPKYYAVSSASVSAASPTLTNPTMSIRLGPIPDAIYPLTVDYYGKTAADSITVGGTTVTWLSVTAPEVLLYGALVQAYTFMKGEPDVIQMYDKQFMEGLALLKNLGEGRQTSDVYSQGQTSRPSE